MAYENDRILILAATVQEAEEWRRQQQIGRTNCRYISHPDALRGLDQPRVAILESFWSRKDVWEMRNMLAYNRPVDWRTGKPITDRLFPQAKRANAEVEPTRKRFKVIKAHDSRTSFQALSRL